MITINKLEEYKSYLQKDVQRRLERDTQLGTLNLSRYATDLQYKRYTSKEISEKAFRKHCLDRLERMYTKAINKRISRVEKGIHLSSVQVKAIKREVMLYEFEVTLSFNGGQTKRVFSDLLGEDFSVVFTETNLIDYIYGKALAVNNGSYERLNTSFGYTTPRDLVYLCEMVGLPLISNDIEDNLGTWGVLVCGA